ncbi:hypothetical protein F2P81_012436 [Scophthalmus maximus]|uniref:Uncharacterized protein n=1 Tax=Scophthalmus maximus TaxID=52904 RepID=A0A6A4SRD0_SCOMX|nr:hypothetical protein F2P81_012436 [Scophthalmus maximus]
MRSMRSNTEEQETPEKFDVRIDVLVLRQSKENDSLPVTVRPGVERLTVSQTVCLPTTGVNIRILMRVHIRICESEQEANQSDYVSSCRGFSLRLSRRRKVTHLQISVKSTSRYSDVTSADERRVRASAAESPVKLPLNQSAVDRRRRRQMDEKRRSFILPCLKICDHCGESLRFPAAAHHF